MAGQPRKPLADHVRDGTFEARRAAHRELLAGDDVPWPALAALQARYRDAENDFGRRTVAREFELAIRAAHAEAAERADEAADDLATKIAELGPAHSAQRRKRFFEGYYRWADGSHWRLELLQAEFLDDLYERKHGRRVYKEAGLGLPRGQGKTPMASGICTAETADVVGIPTNAYQIAGSKLQASIGTRYAVNFVGGSELEEIFRTRRNSIVRRDGRGAYVVLGSDGRLAHGLHGRYVAVVDELWLFKSDNEVQGYTAFESALHKDPESFLLWISTAGYDRRSLLGRKYRRGLACPEIETRRDGFLTIGRDREAGYLMWWFGMPDGYELDLEDDQAVMRALQLANPFSWTDHREMLRSLRRAMTGQLDEGDEVGDELEWLRLYLNYWTAIRGAWLKPGAWRALKDTTLLGRKVEIPAGADVYVAVDAAQSYDTTAVSWSWFSPELGKVVTRCHVFSVRPSAPAHTYVDDYYDAAGDMHVAERFIHELADKHRLRVREVVADPNYFSRELARLGQRFLTAPVYPQTLDMRDYVQRFYRDVHGGRIVTDGDLVVTAHVEAIVAEKTADGYWTIKKRNNPEPMDAGTATIISNGRAQPDRRNVSVYESRGIELLEPLPESRDDEDFEPTGVRQALAYDEALARALGLDPTLDDADLDDDQDEDDEWDI